MRIAVFSALVLLLFIFLMTWLITQIRYRVSPNKLRVTLFGLTLRRLALDRIESISKRRTSGLSEFWLNTTKPKHRVLVIRKKRGLIRNFVISPKNRYVFRSYLEKAIAQIGLPTPEGEEPISIWME